MYAIRSYYGFSGDPLDVAIALRYAADSGDVARALQGQHLFFPFEAELRRSIGVVDIDDKPSCVVKGAWEALRPLLAGLRQPDGALVPATDAELERAEATMENLARDGYRVVAVAARALAERPEGDPDPRELEQSLSYNFV